MFRSAHNLSNSVFRGLGALGFIYRSDHNLSSSHNGKHRLITIVLIIPTTKTVLMLIVIIKNNRNHTDRVL